MTAPRQARAEGWGVPKSLESSQPSDRRGSHAQIFFLAPGVLNQSNEIKQSKAESFQWLTRQAPRILSYLFLVAPGGRSKVFPIANQDRWARHTNFFDQFRNHFLEGPRSFRLQKNAAKFGVGGR